MEYENELLANAKLTSKGQITIPKVVRQTLGIDEGDIVIFCLDKDKNVKMSNIKDCKVETDNSSNQVVVKRGKNNEQ